MRAATRSPTLRPTCVEPVKLISGMRRSSTKRCASSVPGVVEQVEDVREAGLLERGVADLHGRDRAERGLGRRLPDRDVAAHRGEERVPGPHRHGEVERADHADEAERMPLLVHAVPGALGVHAEPVQHPRLAHGEVGDVDHLLDLAVALGLDLAHLERDQRAERVLVLAERVAAQAHGLAAPRRRRVAPLRPGALRVLDHALVLLRRRGVHVAEQLARGRVDRLDRAGVRARGPFAAAEVGAGVLDREAELMQGVGKHAIAPVPAGSWDAGAARRPGIGEMTGNFSRAARAPDRAGTMRAPTSP
jgi:hypothetical protein